MKYLGKIFWGIISTVICLAYKTDAHASCTFSVTNREKLSTTTTLTFATCSAATICTNIYNPSGNCGGLWMRVEDIQDMRENHNNIIVNTLCSQNYYIASCKDSAGTTISLPTQSSIENCRTGIVCSSCPDNGEVQISKILQYGSNYYAKNYLYVCGSIDAVSDSNLGGLYMQEVRLTCNNNSSTAMYPKTDCYLVAGKTYSNNMGSFIVLSSCYYAQ